MTLRGVSVLIATASLLMVFQCCHHVCVCDDGDIIIAEFEDEDDDLLLEVEEEEGGEVMEVFEPTHEWKTVKEGQAIPPGLHVRMNMETGSKEAKLMPDSKADTTAAKSEKTQSRNDDIRTPPSMPTKKKSHTETKQKKAAGDSVHAHPGFLFRGDQRRAHYYGHSDRRGIVNKRRRVFSQREVAETLKKIDESQVDLTKLPGIAYSQPIADQSHNTKALKNGRKSTDDITITHQDREPRIEKPMHPDLAQMMEHARTLTRQTATVPELLQALEELEYHVHHIGNAMELNSIGGMVVVVRLLNHTHPEVRSSAAHVIGAATQRWLSAIGYSSTLKSMVSLFSSLPSQQPSSPDRGTGLRSSRVALSVYRPSGARASAEKRSVCSECTVTGQDAAPVGVHAAVSGAVETGAKLSSTHYTHTAQDHHLTHRSAS